MRNNKNRPGSKKPVAPATLKNEKKEYLTMSQQQNRYGKGRERNGSEGEDQVRGSNH